MNQSEPKFIGKRIAVHRSKQSLKIEIGQQIERWQEALLIAWFSAWSFCGAVFIGYAYTSEDKNQQIFFVVCSSLWLFFFVRIAKVFIWRRIGKEIITINPGEVTIKNAFGRFGRTEKFASHNIFKLGVIKKSPTNFFAFLDDSFWIIGGDKVGFNYNGKKIRLGKQLNVRDTELLVRVIESGLREIKS